MAELALRQHGVVARRQLDGLGVGRRAIDRRVERGWLHHIHRGVYAVGHRGLSSDGHVMAAVLAGGEGAVVSHRSAGALWGVCADRATAVEITVPVTRRDRAGIVQHQATLARNEQTTVRRIPVTTAFRTLLDLAAVLDARQLRRALHEAEVLRLRDDVSLGQLIERHRGRRGVATLRGVRADGALGTHVTRNEFELRFLELIGEARLPTPQVNGSFTVAGRIVEIDFAWPDRRLAVELDGHATHATRRGFERDREQDRILQAAGWRVVRVTWRQLHAAPRAVVADLRTLLAGWQRGPP
jgi:very-short-patch-repair endonuclease